MLITIFVRHTAGCKYAGNEFAKKCDCRKHFRWTQNGKQFRKQAGTRSWEDAEARKRQLEDQLAGREQEPGAGKQAMQTEDAVKLFLAAKTFEGITPHRIVAYQLQLRRLRAYCEKAGVFTVRGITPELLTGFCGTWTTSSGTRLTALKTLKCFLRHCFESEWISRIPKTPRISVDTDATEPLTADEYAGLLSVTQDRALRALIQLMRFSGLAIRDAVTLLRSEIQPAGKFYRVITARQKTGTHVSVPVPTVVTEEILAATDDPVYVFPQGKGTAKSLSNAAGIRMSALFTAAGIPGVCFMKSHRLRDTFAVELLVKGVPLEEVSKLLGHKSIRTTELHYAKWVKGRQDRLDSAVVATWPA